MAIITAEEVERFSSELNSAFGLLYAIRGLAEARNRIAVVDAHRTMLVFRNRYAGSSSLLLKAISGASAGLVRICKATFPSAHDACLFFVERFTLDVCYGSVRSEENQYNFSVKSMGDDDLYLLVRRQWETWSPDYPEGQPKGDDSDSLRALMDRELAVTIQWIQSSGGSIEMPHTEEADVLPDRLRAEMMDHYLDRRIEFARQRVSSQFDDQDGPVPPDGFRYQGTVFHGLTPIPWRLIAELCGCEGATAARAGLGESVWMDHAIDPTEHQVGSARREINSFFTKNGIPLAVATNKQFVSLILKK